MPTTLYRCYWQPEDNRIAWPFLAVEAETATHAAQRAALIAGRDIVLTVLAGEGAYGELGPAATAERIANAALSAAGLHTYTETRQALAELVVLAQALANACPDRVDLRRDTRIPRARQVLSS
jgi:hypothetical protein